MYYIRYTYKEDTIIKGSKRTRIHAHTHTTLAHTL